MKDAKRRQAKLNRQSVVLDGIEYDVWAEPDGRRFIGRWYCAALATKGAAGSSATPEEAIIAAKTNLEQSHRHEVKQGR
jgi:hypothetical protein